MLPQPIPCIFYYNLSTLLQQLLLLQLQYHHQLRLLFCHLVHYRSPYYPQKYNNLVSISLVCASTSARMYVWETLTILTISSFKKYLPSGSTAPIASSELSGARIFLETMISSSVSSSIDDITSPIITPPRGMAQMITASEFCCSSIVLFFLNFDRSSSLLPSCSAASFLSLNDIM